MANAVYNKFKQKLINGDIDFTNDTIKAILVTDQYTPNIDTDEFLDDVTNEVSGAGYTTGGLEITGKTVTVDTDNDLVIFSGSDLTWATSTITARGIVIYKDTGNSTTSPLICYLDMTIDRSSLATDFVIRWSDSGIIGF